MRPTTITLELPWPPSVNHYWPHRGRRTYISREGKRFLQAVAAIVCAERGRGGVPRHPLVGGLSVTIVAHPPDKRTRDLDNVLKPLLDAMQKVLLIEDDGNIDHIDIRRGAIERGGKVVVSIMEMQRCHAQR